MKFNRKIVPGFALGLLLLFSSQSYSQNAGKSVALVAEVCATTACGDIEPATALIILAPTGLNVLYGPNDLGKSTLAEALRAALLLPSTSSEHKSFVPSGTDNVPKVVLTFEAVKTTSPAESSTS